GVIRVDTEMISERLLIGKLYARCATLGVHRDGEVIGNLCAVGPQASDGQIVANLARKTNIVAQIHVEQRPAEQRALGKVPLKTGIIVDRPDRLQIRIATSPAARTVDSPRCEKIGESRERRVVRTC